MPSSRGVHVNTTALNESVKDISHAIVPGQLMIIHPTVPKETVTQKIEQVFPKLENPLKDKYANLVAFLCDMAAVVERLKSLDTILENSRIFNNIAETNIFSQRKILSNTLGESEVVFGFSGKFTPSFHPSIGTSGGLLPTLTGYGEPEDVKQLISQGSHWRDVGVSTAHGEYSHRLQWYAISKSGLFDVSDIRTLYTKSVSDVCETRFYGNKTYYMWDFIVDCFERNHNQTPSKKEQTRLTAYDDFADPTMPISIRFRSPAVLNKFLWEADDLPFLRRFTNGRVAIQSSQDKKLQQERQRLSQPELKALKQEKGSVRSQASVQEVERLGGFELKSKNIYVPASGH